MKLTLSINLILLWLLVYGLSEGVIYHTSNTLRNQYASLTIDDSLVLKFFTSVSSFHLHLPPE